jgi:YgiT-type zinc finger domain-containing protein
MKCQTPGCGGEHDAQTISHSVTYMEKTFVIHNVPAGVCPECGDTVLSDETLFQIGSLLARKVRSKRGGFLYES